MTNIINQLKNLKAQNIITDKEFDKIVKRVEIQVEQEKETKAIEALSLEVKEFMVPGTEYKISDLVMHVMNIKAPCHGYKETEAEQKHRDGVAKPRMKRALALLNAQTSGTGAQTRYVIPTQVPAIFKPIND
jgi:hypothetical protein